MTYLIIEPCIDVKDGDCTQVCPVDCIYEGGRMFYIQPDECVNCGLCVSVCPVDAIIWDGDVTAETKPFEDINREFFGPTITNWGAPGGWDVKYTTTQDHPLVAATPQRAAPLPFAGQREEI